MILSSPILFLFTCPSTPTKTGALGRGLIRTILSSPILFLFTCPSIAGALGRGLIHTILSYPILFLITCPSAPAKIGALGRGLIIQSYHLLSYFALPARVPLQKLGLVVGSGLIRTILSSPILFLFTFHLPEYPCKNWGSRQGASTYDPIISFPIPLYLPEYPCKN